MEFEEKARAILLAAGATDDEAEMITMDACDVYEGAEGGKELVDWLMDHLEDLRSYGPAFESGEDGRLYADGRPVVMAGNLVLGEDTSGPRCFLLDRPVHSGVEILLLVAGGHWVPGRFAWSRKPSELPRIRIDLGGSWEDLEDHPDIVPDRPTVEFELPEDALLTWPSEFN